MRKSRTFRQSVTVAEVGIVRAYTNTCMQIQFHIFCETHTNICMYVNFFFFCFAEVAFAHAQSWVLVKNNVRMPHNATRGAAPA